MSFYGNVSNASRTNLKFDKVYPNKITMDEQCNSDGVFIGRYVLIEYSDSIEPIRIGYLDYFGRRKISNGEKDEYTIYIDSSHREKYKRSEADDSGYGISELSVICTQVDDKYYYFQLAEDDDSYFDLKFTSDKRLNLNNRSGAYELNYNLDKDYSSTSSAETDSFTTNQGWDATVWKKEAINGKISYKFVSKLSTFFPTMSIASDPPSITPAAPHFDPQATNSHYTLRMPDNWGFRVKEAENENLSDMKTSTSYYDEDGVLRTKSYNADIYFNKKGFDKNISVRDDETSDYISILPTGVSGKKYQDLHTGIELNNPIDTQELSISLPGIGNAINDLWNIVYGEGNENSERNTLVNWGNLEGLRLISRDAVEPGYIYNIDDVDNIAGCINTLHDMIGSIIIDESKNPSGLNSILPKALTQRIYYGKLDAESAGNKFYYKKNGHKIVPLSNGEEYSPSNRFRTFYDLTQYNSDDNYFIKINNNFYKQTVDFDSGNETCYELGEPKPVQLKNWQERKEVTGEDGVPVLKTIYSYYKENDNYIIDKNEQPDRTKSYYNIIGTKIAEDKEIFNATDSVTVPPEQYPQNVANAIRNIPDGISVSVKSGYFKEKIESGKKVLILLNSQSTFEESVKYFYIENYVLMGNYNEGGQIEDETIYLVGFNGTNTLLPLTEILGNSNYYNQLERKYKKDFITYADHTYYSLDENGSYILLNNSAEIEPEKEYYTLSGTNEIIYGLYQDNLDRDTFFYTPNDFYYKHSDNYLIDQSKKKRDNIIYYLLTDKNNNILKREFDGENFNYLELEEERIRFYVPNKYYYRSVDNEDVLDSSEIMKDISSPLINQDFYSQLGENRVYYLTNEYYVYSDTEQILEKGAIWNKNVAPPSSITLGKKVDEEQWIELKEFGESLNTINGLILKLNQYFNFEDTVSRENDTIQGCLNSLRDLLNSFYQLNPNDIVYVDAYGRLTGISQNGIGTDSWLSYNSPSNIEDTIISIEHNEAQNINLSAKGETANREIKFGDSFKTLHNEIDAKGHIFSSTERNMTMPSLTFSSDSWIEHNFIVPSLGNEYSLEINHSTPQTANVTKGQAADSTINFGGNFKVLRQGVDEKGHVSLLEEKQITLPSLSFGDDINNGNLLTNIGLDSSNQKLIRTKANVGSLLLTGYTLGSSTETISNTDSVNAAFGKLQAQLNTLKGNSNVEGSVAYQIAQIVNENNNGSIDTLNEIAAWIVNDTSGAAKMSSDINNLIQKSVDWDAAEPNVKADWNEVDSSSDSYILNKPNLSDVVRTNDISNVVRETTTYSYSLGDGTSRDMTISQLVAYIGALESRIAALEAI